MRIHVTTKGVESSTVLEEARTAFSLGLPVDIEAVLAVCEKLARERNEAVAALTAEQDAVETLLRALDDFSNTLQEEVDDGMKLTKKAAQALRKAQGCHDKVEWERELRS
jgi:uncharacterized protein YoxC